MVSRKLSSKFNPLSFKKLNLHHLANFAINLSPFVRKLTVLGKRLYL